MDPHVEQANADTGRNAAAEPLHAHAQHEYQVRFDWGAEGLRTIAPGADVIVVIDVLNTGGSSALTGLTALTDSLASSGQVVVPAGLHDRTAVARWIRGRQAVSDGRFIVAIVAAGDVRDDASLRFTVEDYLAAGAMIDALAELGIDYHSPEAAAACASFTTLKRAIKQLVAASASGRQLIEHGRRDEVDAASQLDSSDSVFVSGAPA